jgi:hypothetical protein
MKTELDSKESESSKSKDRLENTGQRENILLLEKMEERKILSSDHEEEHSTKNSSI